MIISPRGTQDILPPESALWRHFEGIVHQVARNYSYGEIRTPIIEHSELFERGVGKETDIVTKEMYTFLDKGGRSLTLRPEGTAPVCRAFLEHRLQERGLPQKLYYIGPMFRYERPQAGRFRQHHQFGFEALGGKEPELDAELISIAISIFKKLGISEFRILLNSIGCSNCRPNFFKALRDYLQPRVKDLCQDCQRRLDTNPMRVLDCKNPTCQEILQAAPSPSSMLCEDCQEHFQRLQDLLKLIGLEFVLQPRLVRGLDYYTRTVFEIVSPELGAQNSLVGGGRYDGLISSLGGPPLPGVGFAGGIERAINILKGKQEKPYLEGIAAFLVYFPEGKELALKTALLLREADVPTDLLYGEASFSTQLKAADRKKARFAIIIGEEEMKHGIVSLKEMASGNQEEVPYDHLLATLKERS